MTGETHEITAAPGACYSTPACKQVNGSNGSSDYMFFVYPGGHLIWHDSANDTKCIYLGDAYTTHESRSPVCCYYADELSLWIQSESTQSGSSLFELRFYFEDIQNPTVEDNSSINQLANAYCTAISATDISDTSLNAIHQDSTTGTVTYIQPCESVPLTASWAFTEITNYELEATPVRSTTSGTIDHSGEPLCGNAGYVCAATSTQLAVLKTHANPLEFYAIDSWKLGNNETFACGPKKLDSSSDSDYCKLAIIKQVPQPDGSIRGQLCIYETGFTEPTWTSDLMAEPASCGFPAGDHANNIYVCSSKRLYIYNPQSEDSSPVYYSPIITNDLFDPNSQLTCTPTVSGGTALVTSDNGRLYCFHEAGNPLISGHVYHDLDYDGVGDVPISQIKVACHPEVVIPEGIIMETNTDSNGYYYFEREVLNEAWIVYPVVEAYEWRPEYRWLDHNLGDNYHHNDFVGSASVFQYWKSWGNTEYNQRMAEAGPRPTALHPLEINVSNVVSEFVSSAVTSFSYSESNPDQTSDRAFFFTDECGHLYKMDDDDYVNKVVDAEAVTGQRYTSPAINEDGIVFFVSGAFLYAYDPSTVVTDKILINPAGTGLLEYAQYSSPIVVDIDGVTDIYVGTAEIEGYSSLVKVRYSGSLDVQWSHLVPGIITGPPVFVTRDPTISSDMDKLLIAVSVLSSYGFTDGNGIHIVFEPGEVVYLAYDCNGILGGLFDGICYYLDCGLADGYQNGTGPIHVPIYFEQHYATSCYRGIACSGSFNGTHTASDSQSWLFTLKAPIYTSNSNIPLSFDLGGGMIEPNIRFVSPAAASYVIKSSSGNSAIESSIFCIIAEVTTAESSDYKLMIYGSNGDISSFPDNYVVAGSAIEIQQFSGSYNLSAPAVQRCSMNGPSLSDYFWIYVNTNDRFSVVKSIIDEGDDVYSNTLFNENLGRTIYSSPSICGASDVYLPTLTVNENESYIYRFN